MEFSCPGMYMNIEFESHKGKMHKYQGYVIFYNLLFDSITSAALFLRNTRPGNYEGTYMSEMQILVDSPHDIFYCGRVWNDGWKAFKQEVIALQNL